MKIVWLYKQLRKSLAQYRVCEKLEPSVVETNFVICLKKMFNKNYTPKTVRWWANRDIIDVSGVEAMLISLLRDNKINFTGVFTRCDMSKLSFKIFILFEDSTYKSVELPLR